METCIRYSENHIFLNVKVNPGASKSAVGTISNGRLKVRIAAAPENGKANEELLSFFAGILGLPKKDIVLESGEKSRLKTLRFPISAKDKLESIIDDHD